MCGITGIYSSNKISYQLKKGIEAMNTSIKHRGPDAGGFYLDKNLALGHRNFQLLI